jgi:hypothetical protein
LGGVFAKNISLQTKLPSPFGSGNCSSLDWYFSQIPLPNMIYLFIMREVTGQPYQRFFYWRWKGMESWVGTKNVVLCSGYNAPTLFSKSTKELTYREYSPNTLAATWSRVRFSVLWHDIHTHTPILELTPPIHHLRNVFVDFFLSWTRIFESHLHRFKPSLPELSFLSITSSESKERQLWSRLFLRWLRRYLKYQTMWWMVFFLISLYTRSLHLSHSALTVVS